MLITFNNFIFKINFNPQKLDFLHKKGVQTIRTIVISLTRSATNSLFRLGLLLVDHSTGDLLVPILILVLFKVLCTVIHLVAENLSFKNKLLLFFHTTYESYKGFQLKEVMGD